jgi:lysophospholipase L1-like esterase
MLACFGDSITEGKPGVSYVKYLDGINFGLGGDTVLNLTKRLDALNFEKYDELVIEIGTNDILLPFLRSYSKMWERSIESIIKSGRVPSETKDEFENNYEKMINKVKHKKVYVVSIPMIGEILNSDLNKKVHEYNEIIIKMCKRYNVKYIDFNSWQKEVVKNSNTFISKNPFGMVLDSIFVRTPLISKITSKMRNLVTTIDGVHLNDYGAYNLAKMIISNT